MKLYTERTVTVTTARGLTEREIFNGYGREIDSRMTFFANFKKMKLRSSLIFRIKFDSIFILPA